KEHPKQAHWSSSMRTMRGCSQRGHSCPCSPAMGGSHRRGDGVPAAEVGDFVGLAADQPGITGVVIESGFDQLDVDDVAGQAWRILLVEGLVLGCAQLAPLGVVLDEIAGGR